MGDSVSRMAQIISPGLVFWALFRTLPQLSEGWSVILLTLVLLVIGRIYVGSRKQRFRRW